DIAETRDHRDLAGHHHIGAAPDAVDKRFAAAVKIIELRLGDGIIDVDRGPKKLAVAFHQIKPVDTGCGLLAHAFDGVAAFAVPAGNEGKPLLDRGEENFFFLIAWLVEKSRVARLGTHTEVNEHGG